MNARTIRAVALKKPFEPCQVILSSGDRYEVRHPENLMILQEAVGITLRSRPGGELPLQLVFCSYLHVAAIEPLPLSNDPNQP